MMFYNNDYDPPCDYFSFLHHESIKKLSNLKTNVMMSSAQVKNSLIVTQKKKKNHEQTKRAVHVAGCNKFVPHHQRPQHNQSLVATYANKPSITQNDKVRWAVEEERYKNPTVQDLTRANRRVCCKKVTFFFFGEAVGCDRAIKQKKRTEHTR